MDNFFITCVHILITFNTLRHFVQLAISQIVLKKSLDENPAGDFCRIGNKVSDTARKYPPAAARGYFLYTLKGIR